MSKNVGHKWQPGESGNPAGRPVKNRALTEILTKAGARTIDAQGKRIARKRWMAEKVWEAVTMGRVVMPDGEVLVLGAAQWTDMVKWLYVQIDGPAKQDLDITSEDQPIRFVIVQAPSGESVGE